MSTPPDPAEMPSAAAATPPELTTRTVLTLVCLAGVIIPTYIFGRLTLLRTHPHLHLLLHLIVVLASWSAYATVRSSPLRRARHLTATRHASAPPCRKCGRPKPPRTHHCSTCDACTPGMCHHCGVLGVCVGEHNRKPFMLLLFYGFFPACLHVVAGFPEACVRATAFLKGGKVGVPEIVWFQTYYLQYCMMFGLGGLLTFHVYLVAMGRTVLDVCRFGSCRDCFPPWRAVRKSGDRGVVGNLQEVFGSGLKVFMPIVEEPCLMSVVGVEDP